MSSPSGIWSSNSGSTGLSPSLLGVKSAARMSDVAVSMARCTLRPLSRFEANRCRAAIGVALDALLTRLPFAITEELDACAIHEQVQGAIGAAIRDLDSEGLLPSAKGGVVGHRPVQVSHLQQAGHRSSRLPEWQLEQDPDGEAELDPPPRRKQPGRR